LSAETNAILSSSKPNGSSMNILRAGRHFDLSLDFAGTDFQRKVWRGMLAIPFGQTRSYGQIAKLIGSPAAARAVGAANARNPISIVIPCHRLIGSTGELTGFAGGLKAKERLLNLEDAVSKRVVNLALWAQAILAQAILAQASLPSNTTNRRSVPKRDSISLRVRR
jgi:O-6-methylguanine DNA methyltransferase